VGDAGVGKTTIAHAFATDAGFDITESHAADDRDKQEWTRLFSDARKPTFFGQERCVIIEDASCINASGWASVEAEVKRRAIPILIIAQSEADVKWTIRRDALVHRIEQPDLEQRLDLLNSISGEGADLERLKWIAKVSSSWRSAEILLRTTPPDWVDAETSPLVPMRTGHDEIRAILSGERREDISAHPLAMITAAEYNCAAPQAVIEAMRLNSLAWVGEGLSEVATAYLTTLRAPTADRPPFRKRELKGASRWI